MKFKAMFGAALAAAAMLACSAPAFASGVTADVTAHIHGTYAGTSAFGSVALTFDDLGELQLSAGTGLGKADIAFLDNRTLATATSENLDLAGTLLDSFGQTVNLQHVKVIYIRADPTNTTNITVGGASTNAFLGPLAGTTPTYTIPPGGFILWVHPTTGWAVTSGTGDLFKVLNAAGASAKYKVAIFGTSN